MHQTKAFRCERETLAFNADEVLAFSEAVDHLHRFWWIVSIYVLWSNGHNVLQLHTHRVRLFVGVNSSEFIWIHSSKFQIVISDFFFFLIYIVCAKPDYLLMKRWRYVYWLIIHNSRHHFVSHHWSFLHLPCGQWINYTLQFREHTLFQRTAFLKKLKT